MMNEIIAKWYDEHQDEVMELSKKIWDASEVAMEEFESCRLTAEFLEKQGFKVTTYHCCDSSKKPNTVIAEWGSGKPVIGFIGEYDSLPGLGQKVSPYRDPTDGNGQGCGHSLMAPSCGSAAAALKAAMEAEGLSGTVKFFACPAEETVEGKMHMVRDGAFDGLDCCLAWHPQGHGLKVREFIQNSLTNMKVEFFGTSAHAAVFPEKGRSALDACEIMNVGVNYLREHCEPTTRIHYSYISAGEKPNIVPAYAALHYFVRTKDLKSNYETFERVAKCAEGAAIMTETQHKITVNAMVSGCMQISDFNQFFYESAAKVPPLVYTEEDMAFARELFTNIHGREPAEGEEIISTQLIAPTHNHVNAPSSTDVGYVTRMTPTSRMVGLGMITNTPMHSWGSVAAAGHPIGLKSAVYAGKCQAQCGYDILKNPDVIKPWREDLDRQLKEEGEVKIIFPERIN